ncbi:MAG TPA: DNA polymerase Y family protein [Candidatus Polarisedimenticolaceae bacterium]|nr:DNA polymerase Y family protein [Candidatus Polarisedimenticolaceae bacterium]
MDRTACIDLPAFPLQLLLRKHPEWREHPAAVVEADTPQAPILWINEKARAASITTGMRYAAGLSLAAGLRAAVVSKREIEDEVARIAELLRRFTPRVEPAEGEPGVFWLDAKGLERLFGSVVEWASGLHAEIVRSGFVASLTVGFDRFATYAVSKDRRSGNVPLFLARLPGYRLAAKKGNVSFPIVFNTPVEEREVAREVRLDRLSLPTAARDTLVKLGVTTVGQFVDLPLDGVGVRFGPEVRRLHRLASGALTQPLTPEHPDVPAMRRLILDDPESDAERIIARLGEVIPPFLDEIAAKGRALAELQLGFLFERLGDHLESIQPAAPTLVAKTLMELIRLRLRAVRHLPDGVMEIRLVAREVVAVEKQRELFGVKKHRDLEAGSRALARVKAALGDDAVVRAEPRDAHLPEARFAWVPLTSLTEAKPRPVDEPRLIRRLYATPVPLPPSERHEPDGWLLRGLEQGPVVKVNGPYALSGFWWKQPAFREYHFAETKSGENLWVFYDRGKNRWFLQGEVE